MKCSTFAVLFLVLWLTLLLGLSPAFAANAVSSSETQATTEPKETLRVAVLPDWRPYLYWSKAGQTYHGAAIDLLERLCQTHPVTLELIPYESYESTLLAVEAGEVDVALELRRGDWNAEKRTAPLFLPYLATPIQIVSHKDADLSHAEHATAAWIAGIDPIGYARYPGIQLLESHTIHDCLGLVHSRQADFCICTLYALEPLKDELVLRDLIVHTIPQHTCTLGFRLSPRSASTFRSMLEETIADTSTADLSCSIEDHEHSRTPWERFIYYIYRHPFELLCVFASFTVIWTVVLLTYTRVRLRQRKELQGYEYGYRMLANTFGQAGMEYDYLSDHFSLFGAQRIYLDIPEQVDSFREKLLEGQLNLSLTAKDLDSILTNDQPGKSYSIEFQCGMRDGTKNWFRMIYIVISTKESHRRPIRVIGCLVNIEQEYREKAVLLERGRNDPLTGLLNRATAEEEIMASLKTGTGMLFLIDIDYFKQFNDQYGHLCGDSVLRTLGQALQAVFRADDVLCRWGGDEFLIFLKNITPQSPSLQKRLEQLRDQMVTFAFEGHTLPVTLSIGGVQGNAEDTVEALCRKADIALYQVKERGRNGYQLYLELS